MKSTVCYLLISLVCLLINRPTYSYKLQDANCLQHQLRNGIYHGINMIPIFYFRLFFLNDVEGNSHINIRQFDTKVLKPPYPSIEPMTSQGCNTLLSSYAFIVMGSFQNFSIIAWNIHGVLGASTERHAHYLIPYHHPTMLMLIETRVIIFRKVVHLWNFLKYSQTSIQGAKCNSGGICVFSNLKDYNFRQIFW